MIISPNTALFMTRVENHPFHICNVVFFIEFLIDSYHHLSNVIVKLHNNARDIPSMQKRNKGQSKQSVQTVAGTAGLTHVFPH